MNRRHLAAASVWVVSVLTAACGTTTGGPQSDAGPPRVAITTATVGRQPVVHTLRVTGTLMADEEAEVAAESSGRVIGTPVERGSKVAEGSPLVVLAPLEAQAQANEADANIAQLEARLALAPGEPFDPEKIPEVDSARASRDLAEADFNRIRSLLDQKVVSQAEYDQRRTQAEAARNQYAAMRNTMQQQYRLLEASRARASLAHKSLADTVVRSPFAGVVVERKISVGDFVTRGTKVVTVVKVAPLRLELTVPEQSVAAIAAGESVRLQVNAYPGRSFEGQVRFVSPSVRADQRSLMVEAVVPNRDGLLRPGMFVAAEISLPSSEPSLVVPSEAVETAGGISRVFVVHGDRVEERMVTLGQVVGPTTEIVRGLNAGDTVAVSSTGGLSDGARVRVAGDPAGAPLKAPASTRGNK